MSRGVVLFAFDTDAIQYTKMASWTAGRVSRYLGLPTTVITNISTPLENVEHQVVVSTPPENTRNRATWYNKQRYEVFELSPYSQTLMIDVDYCINSDQLLRTFDLPSDFVCYNNCNYFFEQYANPPVGMFGAKQLWATVVRFDKTLRSEQVFNMMKMVQDNYNHYATIYSFPPYEFRNDFALTIALKTVNGQLHRPEDFIPGKLMHVNTNTKITRINDTEYRLDRLANERPHYIKLINTDFHVLSKDNFRELL